MSTALRRSLRPGSFAILVSLLTISPASGQDAARFDQLVQAFVESRDFMGSVLVARDGEILFSKAYGFANVEWDIPNTPTTKFRIGSITKQFTAASILLLEERGKLKTDDLVSKHVPDAAEAWKAVTIAHLLTHTSGIPNFTSFPEYRSRQPFTTSPEQIVSWFRDKPLEFSPASR